MTIPITPGPFAFLAEAGQAVGAIGTALQAKRQRLDTEARSRLSDILSLINAGADPAPFIASGGAAAEHLGLAPAGQGAQLLTGPAERARLALRLTQGQVRKEEAGATKEEVTLPFAEPTARAELRTAEAGATTAEATATAAKSDLGVRTRINELITTELRNPETNFGKLAARAASGVLPYYSMMLQAQFGNNSLERERQHELFQLFFNPLSAAPDAWRERVKAWETRRTLETSGFSPEDIKKWDDTNPKPDLTAVQQELLEAAASARHLTVDQYNSQLNEIVGLTAKADSLALPPPKLQLLQTRVTQVMSGAMTVEQVIDEIKQAYAQRGLPPAQANFLAQLDSMNFQRLLEEAKGGQRR